MNGNSVGKNRNARIFRVAKIAARMGGKAVLGLLTCAVLLIFYKAVTRAPVAKADTSVYYPSFCLGGWKNPQNASGQSDLPANDFNPSDFTTNNSAFLGSAVASQIFCGYFPVDDKTNPPSNVTLTFNWSMASAQAASSTQSSSQNSSGNSSSNGDGSLSSSSGLIIATSTGFTVASSSPDNSTSGNSNSDSSSTSPVPSTDSSTQAPAPTDNSSASSSAPTSFLYDILSRFAEKAQADGAGFIDNAFFQISYTTDGVNWTTAGSVSEGNFLNYSLTIPVSSWDDLKNLQVKVDTLPRIDAKPAVYLESIALSVDYNGSIIDTASDAVAAVDDAANAAADALNNIVQTAAPATPYVPPPPVMTWVKKVSFDFSVSQTATKKDLPWYPKDFRQAAMKNSFDARLSLKKSVDASSLTVSGVCNSSYFVVLVYRNPDDYVNHPASFLYDAANPCATDGTFNFDIASLQLNIPNGTYYLLIGSEGTEGSWIPISPVVPITINASMVQVPVTSTTTNQ